MPVNDIVVSVAPRKTPLRLMAERLRPFVQHGFLDLAEVVDALMRVAIERGMCETPARVTIGQNWLVSILSAETIYA